MMGNGESSNDREKQGSFPPRAPARAGSVTVLGCSVQLVRPARISTHKLEGLLFFRRLERPGSLAK